MTPKQEKLLVEKIIRPMVKKALNEAEVIKLDSQDIKAADRIVQALSGVSGTSNITNNKTIIDFDQQVNLIRRDIMEFIEANAPVKYVAKGGSGWKLVKK